MRRTLLVSTLSILGLAPGCMVLNDVDVCRRPRPVEREINARTEGAQATTGLQPVASLPTGGALVAFQSATAADDDGTGPARIRVAVLDEDGRPAARTCDAPGELEIPGDAEARDGDPSVAMPETPDEELGLVVFSSTGGGARDIRGVFVSQTGCARGRPFVISENEFGTQPGSGLPSVAWLGERTFVVAWTEAVVLPPADIRLEVRLRLVRPDLTFVPQFVPTERAPDGASVPVVARSGRRSAIRVLRVVDHRFLAIWWQFDGVMIFPTFAIFDDRLRDVALPRQLDESPPIDEVRFPTGRAFGAATDGEQILVAWPRLGDDGLTRVRARFLSLEGQSLTSTQSPDGEPFVLRSDAAEDEGRVAIAALPAGGFLAVMERVGGGSGGFQSLHGVVLEPAGDTAFANLACDARSFTAFTSLGDLTDPGLAATADGVIGVLTADGGEGADRSGTGVRAAAFTERTLLPVQ